MKHKDSTRRPVRGIRCGYGVATGVAAACVVLAGAVPASATSAAAPSAAAPSAAAPAATVPAAGQGWIRFGHFSLGTGPVTVTVDGKVLAAAAAFKSVTPYESLAAGTHVVTVTDPASPSVTVSTTVTVASGGADTVTALKGPAGLMLHWFADDLSPAPAGDAKVRIINTIPGDSTVTVDLAPATTAAAIIPAAAAPAAALPATSAPYGAASAYADVPAGQYEVNVAGPTGTSVVSGKNWPVSAGTVASVVVLQDVSGATLEVLSDAAGAAAPPVGGMQTGFGGAATLLARDAAKMDALARRGPAHPVVEASGSPDPVRTTATARPGRQGRQRTVDLASASTGPAVASSIPTTLSIPAIGVRTSVVSLGRNADGTAQVPATTTEAGWYSGSPTPGETGPATLLGHVDSTTGPGVFFRLAQLSVGSHIVVGEGSSSVTFAVQQVSSYAKAAFPTAKVFGPTPDRALRLITCGGFFDRSVGHYVNDVVVYATEVAATPTA